MKKNLKSLFLLIPCMVLAGCAGNSTNTPEDPGTLGPVNVGRRAFISYFEDEVAAIETFKTTQTKGHFTCTLEEWEQGEDATREVLTSDYDLDSVNFVSHIKNNYTVSVKADGAAEYVEAGTSENEYYVYFDNHDGIVLLSDDCKDTPTSKKKTIFMSGSTMLSAAVSMGLPLDNASVIGLFIEQATASLISIGKDGISSIMGVLPIIDVENIDDVLFGGDNTTAKYTIGPEEKYGTCNITTFLDTTSEGLTPGEVYGHEEATYLSEYEGNVIATVFESTRKTTGKIYVDGTNDKDYTFSKINKSTNVKGGDVKLPENIEDYK